MGTNLGSGTTLGGGSTLGGGVLLGVVSTLGGCACKGSGLVCDGIGGGISEAVSGFHAPKRSHSLAMSSSWLCRAVAGASLMAQEIKFRTWTMRYLGVSVGWLK